MNRRTNLLTLAILAAACQVAMAQILKAQIAAAQVAAAQRTVAVATVHPLATDAAIEVFEEGGNAVDAAITAALTLGVVDSHNAGIGGGCLALVRRPDGSLLAIDGRETAPAAASRDMYLRDGKAVPELSRTGPLAAGTPGALAAYDRLLRECGSLPLERLLRPGAEAAEEGFAVSRLHAAAIRRTRDDLAKFPASRTALLTEEGEAPAVGDLLKRPDLARTYRMVGEVGIDYFYRGEFAERTGAWMRDNGGLLTADDFAAYREKRREPIVSSYRGYTVIGFPPPSSGGVHVAQMLGILEEFDLAETFERAPVEGIHLVAEAMKLAFADRAYWLGDADFAKVPRGLTSKAYAKQLAARIDPERSIVVARHGDPPQWRQDLFGRHTTHIAAADSEGWWVAITATVNTSFGSKVIIPGTGVVLNNEMDDFSTQPGAPNAFGLVGAENNSVAPGKRPLSSMSPTIVLGAGGEPAFTIGAAGGPKIITCVLRGIVDMVDRGMTPSETLAQPRYHHQWRPDRLSFERTMPPAMVESLRAKGHELAVLPSAGTTQLIAADAGAGFLAESDPRVDGKASVAVVGPATQPPARAREDTLVPATASP
ncbi:MAG: gamma-glutamyltransferase [Planctomycetota bacterium]